jgi:hypothetical protein
MLWIYPNLLVQSLKDITFDEELKEYIHPLIVNEEYKSYKVVK